jgi:hypothetical protein
MIMSTTAAAEGMEHRPALNFCFPRVVLHLLIVPATALYASLAACLHHNLQGRSPQRSGTRACS